MAKPTFKIKTRWLPHTSPSTELLGTKIKAGPWKDWKVIKCETVLYTLTWSRQENKVIQIPETEEHYCCQLQDWMNPNGTANGIILSKRDVYGWPENISPLHPEARKKPTIRIKGRT